MVFHSVHPLIQHLFHARVWSKTGSGQSVYLTFDDGPVPGVTDFVLKELEKRNMKASFFMVGANVKKNPNLALEVVASGHKVGNHTYHHLNGWKTPNDTYLNDFFACDQILKEVLNIESSLFRPPYGMISGNQAKKISKTHEIIMWNVLSGDYDKKLSTDQILGNTKVRLAPGAIVVFHDQEKTAVVIHEVLPHFLDFILESGFQTKVL
jgi:peptidoglycan/xylan/chitin deacetylase (PgdA/CDA1 family)